jgi:hypothetical protein
MDSDNTNNDNIRQEREAFSYILSLLSLSQNNEWKIIFRFSFDQESSNSECITIENLLPTKSRVILNDRLWMNRQRVFLELMR